MIIHKVLSKVAQSGRTIPIPLGLHHTYRDPVGIPLVPYRIPVAPLWVLCNPIDMGIV